MSKILISVQEVCQALSISRPHLYDLIAQGRFAPKSIRLGRKVLYRADEIESWAQAGCPKPALWKWGVK